MMNRHFADKSLQIYVSINYFKESKVIIKSYEYTKAK